MRQNMAAEAEADLGFPATATAGGGGATNPRPAPRESGRGRADSAAGEGRWRGAADRGGGRSGSNWDREGEGGGGGGGAREEEKRTARFFFNFERGGGFDLVLDGWRAPCIQRDMLLLSSPPRLLNLSRLVLASAGNPPPLPSTCLNMRSPRRLRQAAFLGIFRHRRGCRGEGYRRSPA
ncbi:hypothetical protein DAI22_01g222950 [Oryza sativa Japonica Group]|nr:hypothetical protein DAI22_01g222950 [Oryza sativa Japonica Group]